MDWLFLAMVGLMLGAAGVEVSVRRRRRAFYEIHAWPNGRWQVHLVTREAARLVDEGCTVRYEGGSRLRAAIQLANECVDRDRINREPGPATRSTFKRPA